MNKETNCTTVRLKLTTLELSISDELLEVRSFHTRGPAAEKILLPEVLT